MSLRVWLPLNRSLENQGLDNVVVVAGTNTTFETNGKIGKCLASTGSTSNNVQITISNLETILANGNAYSVCLWAKLTNAVTSGYILRIGDASGGLWWTNVVSSSNTHRYVWNEGDSGKVLTKGDVTIDYDYWHHICVVIDKTELGYIKETYYIDGELTAGTGVTNPFRFSSSGLTTLTGTNIIIYPSIAKINDFRIYDHTLSAQEVKQIAQGLVLHYPLNRNGWGNENLIRGTKNWNLWSRGTRTTYSGDVVTLEGTTADWSAMLASAHFDKSLLDGTTLYTWSFEYKSTADAAIYSYISGTTTGINEASAQRTKYGVWKHVTLPSTNGEWKHYVLSTRTFSESQMTSGSGNVTCCYIQFYNRTDNASVDFRRIKFEKSNIATSWCPNSADEIANSLGMNSNIEYDISGFKNNGVSIGAIGQEGNSPKYGSSAVFNGVDTCIKNPNFIFTSNTWSISLWYYYDTAPTAWETLVCLAKGNGADANKKMALQTNTGKIWFKSEDGSGTYSSLNIQEWTHLVLTCDGVNGKLYENGVLKLTSSAISSIFTDCVNLGVGARNTAEGMASVASFLKGKMSDIRIYATALSATDIKELYEYNLV